MSNTVVEWLLTPISGPPSHAIESWASWHGRLMVLSWSVLLPLGMLAARYFKVTPGQDWPRALDNKLWWRAHLWVQSAGVAAMTLGLLLALENASGAAGAAAIHRVCGWTAVSIGWIQVAVALLRGTKGGPTEPTLRGDHYDMTPRRIAFERVHKSLGWIAVPFAVAATRAWAGARRRPALDVDCSGALVDRANRRRDSPPTGRPLPRHVPGDLGPRSSSSRKQAQADRLGRVAANAIEDW